MVNPNQQPEAQSEKPPSATEIQKFIERQKESKAGKEAEAQVAEELAGTPEGVAEVMAGMEKPKEKVSERPGEKGERRDISGSSAQMKTDDAQQVRAQLKDYDFPSQEVMIKLIRSAITAEIKSETKKARKFLKNLSTGEATDYNAAISRIRRLKEMLASLFTATFDFVKKMYVKHFTPNGKRRKMEGG